ncbi:hypothetical protein F442_08448 [Phytophthora nicotianae P10297]|uniref:Uncharacterized protein n=1 Tax=Phytophthora nicotianae P10297 TaxID=1317064 RepID=W2ZCT0_PHYNI|nr:hypothetical protein F442_08448 [Phytophthora nicotianae P10297]
MESASALLQLVRDAASGAQSSNLRERDLLASLESVRKQLQRSTMPPESNAIAICHVTAQVSAFLIQYRPLAAQNASSKWHKRVFLLEAAVASAFTSFTNAEELKNEDRGDLCNMMKWLYQRLWGMAQTPQQAAKVVTVMTKLCVLLAICWLSYDRIGRLIKVENLLTICSNFCSDYESTKPLAKWPLFLLGMVEMTENQDYIGALECLRSAVEICDGSELDGVLFYWYAVALIHSGHSGDAVMALDKCIRANYEPTVCLSLQALVNLQATDYHAASEQLQRALGINFEDPKSMFNYGLLMEQMDNFEAQQQLLEYVLEFYGAGSADSTAKQLGDADQTKTTALFDERSLASLLPSRQTSLNLSRVHLHLAMAAMENGDWVESKKHFEEFLGVEHQCAITTTVLEAARDYVYVLLQCKLPSLALRKCEQNLQNAVTDTVNEDDMISLLLLHLYKADALLCLERVDECCEYLQQIVQPKIQEIMSREQATTAISEEVVSCHTQLLNNLAVVVACCSGVDPAISILREGLQQYPDCLALKFNLVLLLWRKDDKPAACTMWVKARGWDLQAKINGADVGTTYQNAALSASTSQMPSISEHVQGDLDGEDGISAQQLVYLDALILNYWRKTRESQLVDYSLQYIEYLESLGTTDIPQNN